MSSIAIPGAVFSSLVFHLKNAPSDSEGFLYGGMRTHHVENITDTQSSGTREEKKLYVESFVCFPERFKFYDHYGRPHTERIKALLGDDMKRVIGWFSCRRNSTNRPSMREKVVHRRLTSCLTGVPCEDFLFGLVTEMVVEGSMVHSTDYSFHNWIGTSLQPVKVGIVNLQVTATVPYQLFPLTPTPSSLPHYSSTLQQHRTNFVNSEGHMQQPMLSEQLYKAILGRLKPLCESLSEASLAVEREAREVEQLERQLQELTTLAEPPPAEEPGKDPGQPLFVSWGAHIGWLF
ncbi:BRISC complex subunit Abraxas 2 [Geodia barretti]|uniref:BRISC complex subunit Abraxas 2 n=1 Tax=Geodia barretti TaxID=519541 RepID=A0AA35T579_GEOBA|nr:BRISC complex subunit Abraxas 2 [Geodia barretti]